jgi:putative ABC transport system substrate-binding protein
VLSAVLLQKQLELLRGLIGPAALVAVLAALTTREVQAAARGVKQKLVILNASSEREFDTAFARLKRERAGALLVANDAVFINRREKLVALVARQSIPTIYGRREFLAAGGLMSYGASIIDQCYQSGL